MRNGDWIMLRFFDPMPRIEPPEAEATLLPTISWLFLFSIRFFPCVLTALLTVRKAQANLKPAAPGMRHGMRTTQAQYSSEASKIWESSPACMQNARSNSKIKLGRVAGACHALEMVLVCAATQTGWRERFQRPSRYQDTSRMHYNLRSCCDVVWWIKGTKPGYKTYLAVLAPHAVKICVKPCQVLGAGVLARGPRPAAAAGLFILGLAGRRFLMRQWRGQGMTTNKLLIRVLKMQPRAFRSCTPTPDMFGSIISNASGSKAGKVLFFMIKFLNPQCQCLRKYFLHEETLVRLP